jgi:hypothetical protein
MTHRLSDANFEMVMDAMNAIRITQTENFVKNFNSDGIGFSFSTRPEINIISDAMQYGGHSGSSFGYTMQSCKYYLLNPDEWMAEIELHNIPDQPVTETTEEIIINNNNDTNGTNNNNNDNNNNYYNNINNDNINNYNNYNN